MKYQLIPIRMAIIKKSTNNRWCREYGEKRALLHCGWECKLVLPLRRTGRDSSSMCAESCLTLYDPMDCGLPGSSVQGILQGRILAWVVISFSRGLPNIGMEPVFPALADGFFTTESPGKPWRFLKILKIELLYDPAIPRWGIYPEKIMIPKN